MAIIVLNMNRWKDMIECLESLQRIVYPNYQIIVADNGSTDESIKELNHWLAKRGGDVAGAPSETLASTGSDISFEIIFSHPGRMVD